jgi:hypothetical protein
MVGSSYMHKWQNVGDIEYMSMESPFSGQFPDAISNR